MANVVLVIDMTRAFLEEGHALYCGQQARRIIPNIERLIKKEIALGSSVIFLNDSHDPDDLEFEIFPAHSIVGTEETEVIPEIAGFAGEVINKKRYSAFWNTALGDRLLELRPDRLIIVGVCTDICVWHTAGDARNRDYTVEVPVDCVASFDERGHFFALQHMEKVLGVKITGAGSMHLEPSRFAPSPEVLSGKTADVYFARTIEILGYEGFNPVAAMEVFASRAGVLCGIEEVKQLLLRVLPEGNREVWALSDGDTMQRKEVVLRITAPYRSYGLYETAICGILAHCSGWATASRECVDAAQGVPLISFGARHVHPSVVGVLEYSAIVGGCKGCSSIAGAEVSGTEPIGTMPHALIIVMGGTVRATLAFDKYMPDGVPRVSLVDTFHDEAEESVNVARELKDRLESVRLDTPNERGGVTVDLVKEVRARLDLAGYRNVGIFVSGGVNPERIRHFLDSGAPVDGFGVGSYISGARPVDFTADLHQIDNKPVAKRGRIPGITPNPRLRKELG